MLDTALTTIDQRIAAGEPFPDLEDYIDSLPLQHEQQSVLWLYAWVESDTPARREAVLEFVR